MGTPLSEEDQLGTKHVEKEKSWILLRGTAQSAAKEKGHALFLKKKERLQTGGEDFLTK